MNCHDCPDLMADRMPANWKPRAECCLEKHRRAELDRAKAEVLAEETARGEMARGENRAERRRRERLKRGRP